MSGLTTTATLDDLRWIWPGACAARLFDTYQELADFQIEGPWRVRVTSGGEAAVVDEWRAGMDLLAVRGLWCSRARVPDLVADLIEVAASRGFARLLGPLVPESEAGPYTEAGLEIVQRVVTYARRRSTRVHATRSLPDGVEIVEAPIEDARAVRGVDAAAFEPFWAYDLKTLVDYMRTHRTAVAQRNSQVIGYTLSTLRGEEGVLGRLAVHPSEQGRGIGAALLADAVEWMGSQGAKRVLLCTQLDNRASRHLYEHQGFNATGELLVAGVSRPVPVSGGVTRATPATD